MLGLQDSGGWAGLGWALGSGMLEEGLVLCLATQGRRQDGAGTSHLLGTLLVIPSFFSGTVATIFQIFPVTVSLLGYCFESFSFGRPPVPLTHSLDNSGRTHGM